jgi:NADPH:quinone reductase-like Zn-dependent oxidoreductase
MRAVVLSEPGPVTNLSVVELPVPSPPDGWVRIRVRAFGLNRSELHTRLGLAEGVTFPRVPGIECVGEIDSPGDLPLGQQVAAMMGDMGRTYDGGYAEYTVVPRAQVIPFTSDLPWSVLGAVPETLQTAYGSLTVGLGVSSGQTVLVRGGTSSVGLAVAALARGMGAVVLSTTRSAARLSTLAAAGVTHPLVDDGAVAAQVRALYPSGVDGAVELVGTPTLPDTLAAVRVRGTVCFTGMLSNEWIVRDFYPIGYLPKGVRLTGYGGDAGDLPAPVLQKALDDIAAGRMTLGEPTVYPMDDIRRAHEDMEHNRVVGKQVVLT